MTPEKVVEVVNRYRRRFREMDGLKKADYPQGDFLPLHPRVYALSHCFNKLDQIEDLAREGRHDKAFRLLGFVQGVLWVLRIYRLEDLKNHNRPAE